MIDTKRRTPAYITKPHIFFNSKSQRWNYKRPARRKITLISINDETEALYFVTKLNIKRSKQS